MTQFDGLGLHLGNLARVSDAETRSISGENPTGERGGGARRADGPGAIYSRDLGREKKVNPCVDIPGNTTQILADVAGPGAIQHIWITCAQAFWRRLVLRCYWDDEPEPSIEVPLGDFFCSGWGEHSQVSSVPVAVNSTGGFNCYWEMPFRGRARVTITNISPDPIIGFFYQITYALTPVGADRAYLHAQWRRSNPVGHDEPHVLLDGVTGRGHYVGTYLAWQSNSSGWWGEGEVKFYLDGDVEHPTICGTGIEDYFGGAWAFEHPHGQYGAYTTPYLGMPQVSVSDGFNRSQQRFGLYRWHVQDPIRFREELRVTAQALGHRSATEGQARYLPLRDDIASTAWWYQLEPHAPFPTLPNMDALEIT